MSPAGGALYIFPGLHSEMTQTFDTETVVAL